jgi:hypothetical protein
MGPSNQEQIMSRQLSLTSFSLAVLAFSTVAAGPANAKECTTSSECADGFECVLGVKYASGTGGSTGTSSGGAGVGAATGTACAGSDCPVSSDDPIPTSPPAQVDGGVRIPTPVLDGGLTTPVITTGTCQAKTLACTSKADCPANLDCVKETAMVNRPACAPDTTCDTTLPVSQTGTCKAVCNVDSDCPAPLACKLQGQSCMGGGSVSSDGTVTTMTETCTGGYKICAYTPVSCTTDAECKDANYQCVKEYETQSCTGSAPTACARTKDDAGVVCTPTTPEPPVCTTTVVKSCQPKEIKCDAGETCPASWTCLDVSKMDYVSPSGAAVPPSKICAPDGLILVIKGQASGNSNSGVTSGSNPTRGGEGAIDLGTGGSTGQSGNGSVTTKDGTVPPQIAPVPASDGDEHAIPGDAGTEASSTKVRGGGCTLGGAQDGALSLWMTLGLVGLVLRLVRRRK